MYKDWTWANLGLWFHVEMALSPIRWSCIKVNLIGCFLGGVYFIVITHITNIILCSSNDNLQWGAVFANSVITVPFKGVLVVDKYTYISIHTFYNLSSKYLFKENIQPKNYKSSLLKH